MTTPDRTDGAHPHVIFAITHTEPGGLREIWQDIAAGLHARGLRTGLVALYARGDEADEARVAGWHFITPQAGRTPWTGLKLLWSTVRWLRQVRPDVVITGMPFCNVLFAAACTLAGTRTKLVLSHHTASFTYQRALNMVDRRTGCHSCVAAIISVSDAVGHSFAPWPAAYRAKQLTIHNSLPQRIEGLADRIAATPRETHEGPLRVIAVGRLSAQKNHVQLIRAMAHVPQARLGIIGAGEDEAALRALIAELGLEARVLLLGQFAREETLRQVAQADVFVQVSLFEGHSLALIEAARLGVPLVVSQVPEQIEGVTDAQGQLCGMTVPLGDDKALGAILRGLAGDAALRRSWADKSAHLGQMRSSSKLIHRYEVLLASLGPDGKAGRAPMPILQEGVA
jgi:glycosyltransferase involved in cell wall biosynthesis